MNEKSKNKQMKIESQKITLSDGTEVVMKRGTTQDLMKARDAANGGIESTLYLIAETSTFNGEKRAAEDLLEMDPFDYMLLEETWGKFAPRSFIQQREK